MKPFKLPNKLKHRYSNSKDVSQREYNRGIRDAYRVMEPLIEQMKACIDQNMVQWEGMHLAIQHHRTNINVEFFLQHFTQQSEKNATVIGAYNKFIGSELLKSEETVLDRWLNDNSGKTLEETTLEEVGTELAKERTLEEDYKELLKELKSIVDRFNNHINNLGGKK